MHVFQPECHISVWTTVQGQKARTGDSGLRVDRRDALLVSERFTLLKFQCEDYSDELHSSDAAVPAEETTLSTTTEADPARIRQMPAVTAL